MHWTDVAGPPGVGKSTLCDPLWKPHEIPIADVPPSKEWGAFLDEITRLLLLLYEHKHWSTVPAVRMNRRSVRKIATVAQTRSVVPPYTFGNTSWPKKPYVQTALIQRGLGFGWRFNQLGMIEECRRFFQLVPISIGAAFLHADQEVIKERNKHRETVKETAHENRSFMVPLMAPAIEIAKEELDKRNVPIIEIDTTQPIEDARAELVEFASREPHNPEAGRPRSKVDVVPIPPIWW